MKEEFDAMKGEVVKEIRKTSDGRGRLTCSLVFLALVLGIVGWFAWTIASTGLFSVPMLSRVAYEEPHPIRDVKPGTPVETVVAEQLQTTLTRRLQQGNGTLTDTSVTLTLDEKSFTSSLQSSLESQEFDAIFESSKSQIVIEEDGTIELFFPFKDRSNKTAMVATMRLQMVDGVLGVETTKVKIGSYTFPNILIEFFNDIAIKPQLETFNKGLGQAHKITSIRYEEGTIVVDGVFEVEIRQAL